MAEWLFLGEVIVTVVTAPTTVLCPFCFSRWGILSRLPSTAPPSSASDPSSKNKMTYEDSGGRDQREKQYPSLPSLGLKRGPPGKQENKL